MKSIYKNVKVSIRLVCFYILPFLFISCQKDECSEQIQPPVLTQTSYNTVELTYKGKYEAVFIEYYLNGWCAVSRTHTTEKKEKHSWTLKTGERYRGVVVLPTNEGLPTNEIKL